MHHLDRAVELAGEPRRRLLPDLAHPLVERGRRDLGVALDLALGDPLEPLGLAPLELDQRQLEPRPGVGLGLLDPLGDRRLARPQPLGDLLDRAAPLDRVRLELVEGLGDGGRRGAFELLAKPDHGLALLVARRAELGRLAVDPGLDVGDRLLLALGQAGELGLEVALRPLEVVGDPLQPLVEPSLHLRRACPRAPRSPAAPARRRSRAAPLRGGAPPLRAGRSCRPARGRACGGSPPRALRSPPPRRRWIGGARRGDERVGLAGAAARAPQREPQADRGHERDAEAGGKDPDGHAGTL